MNTNNDNLEVKNPSSNPQLQAISDDILEDVAGGMNEQDALEKWLRLDKKISTFNAHL